LDAPDLLLEVAVFAASVALDGVSEAFGVHEINGQVLAHIQQVDIAPATVPDATQSALAAPRTPVDPSLIPRLGGRALLDQLGIQDARSVSRFVHDSPKAVAELLNHPPSARDVTRWWSDLPARVQQTMYDRAPEIVGNLNGVPFAVRDIANRIYLEQSITRLRGQLAGAIGRSAGAEVRDRLHTLAQIDRALVATDGGPHRRLISLDTDYPGRAAIVSGDLEHADYVSYLVPGMFFTIDGQVVDWADTAAELYREQTSWLHRFASSDPARAGKTVATVAWIGYETPHLLNVGSLDLANEGAARLTGAIQGLQTLRAGDEPYVSVMAHSYGSTAALIALQRHTFQIDALAVVGSPGSAAQSVAELAVRDGNVYVGEAAWDPVVNTAFYGSDPGAPSYGAHPMSVDGGTDPITHRQLGASFGHNEYFVPGSESLRNMALIGIDEGGYVSGSTTPASR
jgi:hypothetical protein